VYDIVGVVDAVERVPSRNTVVAEDEK